jgi:hypothetical protein
MVNEKWLTVNINYLTVFKSFKKAIVFQQNLDKRQPNSFEYFRAIVASGVPC